MWLKLGRLQELFLILVISTSFIIFYIRYDNYVNDENFIIVKNSRISCGRFPMENDIFIDNVIWQVLELPIGFVKLLNAFLDTRFNKTIVRVNANGIYLNITLDTIYCQFWYDESSQPYVVKASEFVPMWPWTASRNFKIAYLITCPFDLGNAIPTSVSLTANPCDKAENNLKILNNQPFDGVKKKFAVCMKQITFDSPDFGIRFIEWVHMLRILGADKIYFFNRYINRDVFKVLNYMQEQQQIEMWPYLEPSGVPKIIFGTKQARLLEMNTINDCFYRIRNLYEYIAVLDTDEVIMPVMESDKNWEDMMSHFKPSIKADTFYAQNLYYPNTEEVPTIDIPSFLYMLQHVQSAVNFSQNGTAVKGLHNPDRVIVVHNHNATKCQDIKTNSYVKCELFGMPKNIAQLSHYRNKVKKEFRATKLDTTIWKFKDELIKAVNETLIATNFSP